VTRTGGFVFYVHDGIDLHRSLQSETHSLTPFIARSLSSAVFRPQTSLQSRHHLVTPSSPAPPQWPPVRRPSNTTPIATNNPYRQAPPELAGLSLNDEAAPPPDYQAALRASIAQPPTGFVPPPVLVAPPLQQQQQQHYQHARTTSEAGRASPPRSGGGGAPVVRRTSVEDPLAPLGKYDVVILVDDVGCSTLRGRDGAFGLIHLRYRSRLR
jgi:hypothetical protein